MKRLLLAGAFALILPAAAIAQNNAALTAPPVERTIKLNDAEIDTTVQMLDACVKALGLNCAEAASTITKKLRAAQQPPAHPAPAEAPKPDAKAPAKP